MYDCEGVDPPSICSSLLLYGSDDKPVSGSSFGKKASEYDQEIPQSFLLCLENASLDGSSFL